MECPACKHGLTEVEVNNVTVDICENGCGGIWFDNYEVKKFDEPHEHAGESLLDIKIDASIKVDHSLRRQCPKCDDMTMMRHFFSAKRQVEIDECPNCAGIWLDNGELKMIRNLYNTEEERKQAAKAYFDDMFDDQLKELGKQSAEDLVKAQRLAHMLRFICPSYYIPGR